jgi:uncharacterized protein YutE (UPF0331/DUF86 family)
MLNPEVIYSRLQEMNENLSLLSEINKTDLDKFQSDPKIYKLAERCLEISLECLIDICHYIIASNSWTRPKDNAEAIILVGQRGVIPLEFAKKIVGMANLRNILVHAYLTIDRKLLYEHINHLEDFKEFQKHILTYIKK